MATKEELTQTIKDLKAQAYDILASIEFYSGQHKERIEQLQTALQETNGKIKAASEELQASGQEPPAN